MAQAPARSCEKGERGRRKKKGKEALRRQQEQRRALPPPIPLLPPPNGWPRPSGTPPSRPGSTPSSPNTSKDRSSRRSTRRRDSKQASTSCGTCPWRSTMRGGGGSRRRGGGVSPQLLLVLLPLLPLLVLLRRRRGLREEWSRSLCKEKTITKSHVQTTKSLSQNSTSKENEKEDEDFHPALSLFFCRALLPVSARHRARIFPLSRADIGGT